MPSLKIERQLYPSFRLSRIEPQECGSQRRPDMHPALYGFWSCCTCTAAAHDISDTYGTRFGKKHTYNIPGFSGSVPSYHYSDYIMNHANHPSVYREKPPHVSGISIPDEGIQYGSRPSGQLALRFWSYIPRQLPHPGSGSMTKTRNDPAGGSVGATPIGLLAQPAGEPGSYERPSGADLWGRSIMT
jgi:hypothetical protein